MNREMNLMLELYISYKKKFQHAIKNSLQTNEKKKKKKNLNKEIYVKTAKKKL